MKEYRKMYIITEYDYDGQEFCSHIRWDVMEACDVHREIYGYGGEAHVTYRYRFVEID